MEIITLRYTLLLIPDHSTVILSLMEGVTDGNLSSVLTI